jgi:RNA polymerase sigma factor (sigma-70 family)
MPDVLKSGENDEFVQQVTRGIVNHSEESFQRFYDNYFDRVYRHMLVKTHGNEELTTELVQQVFLRFVRYKREFLGEAPLWTWIKQTARSCHIDWLRRDGAKSSSLLEIAFAAVAEDSDDHEQLDAALAESIAHLRPAEREVITLSYFEGLPHQQIAERLNTTAKAVESKLARIRQKLKREIVEHLARCAALL